MTYRIVGSTTIMNYLWEKKDESRERRRGEREKRSRKNETELVI